MRRVEHIKDGDHLIGSHTRAKVVKNKMAPPFREAYFDIMYGEGISHIGELLDLGVDYDLIKKGGAWFTVNGERFQGRENAKKYLMENKDVADALEEQVRQAIKENREKVKQERKTKKRGKQMEDDEPELDDTDIMDEAPMPDEDEAPRRSAAVSIDADDFGDDDI